MFFKSVQEKDNMASSDFTTKYIISPLNTEFNHFIQVYIV